ncbi:MAG: rhodanese-related sulfurtransferase [Cyanothece sp. SIO1E1]|nr:rhodanese-related sulfurtransferase [Cyanothece sp. SIO1E1]
MPYYSEPAQPFQQISVEALAERLADATERPQLLDVREPGEIAIAQIEAFENLPLSEFAQWADSIQTRFDPEAETIVICHHGMRSAQMCQWLVMQGFTRVNNVIGGIDAYAVVIDASMPRY